MKSIYLYIYGPQAMGRGGYHVSLRLVVQLSAPCQRRRHRNDPRAIFSFLVFIYLEIRDRHTIFLPLYRFNFTYFCENFTIFIKLATLSGSNI